MWRERFQSRYKQLTIDRSPSAPLFFFFFPRLCIFSRPLRSIGAVRSESAPALMAYMAAVHAITPDASF